MRYVLEGSVQPSGSRVRVNAQLIDADTGAHLWAERFDAARGDLLDMQDEIVTRVARALQVRLSAVEAARLARARPENPDAEVLAMRAESLFLAYGISHREETTTFTRLCEEALERDPRNLRALSILALTLAVAVWSGRGDLEHEGRRAQELIDQALAIDANQYLVHHAHAALLMVRRRHEEAVAADERALELNPGYVGTYITLAACQEGLGRPDDGLAYIDKAIRLSPRDPLAWALLTRVGVLRLMRRDDDRAIEALARAVALNPANEYARVWLASAHALTGRVEEARSHLARYLERGAIATVAGWKAREDSDNPAYLAFRERFYEGLRKAGMAEE